MNWEALGAIGEIIGAIGVIVTLIYLAFQIRQNTQQLKQNFVTAKAASVNASTIALRENRKSIYTDAELSEIFRNGLGDPQSLTEAEAFRFRLAVQNVTDAIWEIFSQTAITQFSPETWNSQGVGIVKRIMGTPGGQWFWAAYRSNYPADFQQEIDRILGSDNN